MDIIKRLNDPEMYIYAIDDAICEIEILRARIVELEAASGITPAAPDRAIGVCQECGQDTELCGHSVGCSNEPPRDWG